MTSICEKKISAEARIIHAEQISLYNFIVLRKNKLKTKQVKQDILNQWESVGFPKLISDNLPAKRRLFDITRIRSKPLGKE